MNIMFLYTLLAATTCFSAENNALNLMERVADLPRVYGFILLALEDDAPTYAKASEFEEFPATESLIEMLTKSINHRAQDIYTDIIELLLQKSNPTIDCLRNQFKRMKTLAQQEEVAYQSAVRKWTQKREAFLLSIGEDPEEIGYTTTELEKYSSPSPELASAEEKAYKAHNSLLSVLQYQHLLNFAKRQKAQDDIVEKVVDRLRDYCLSKEAWNAS